MKTVLANKESLQQESVHCSCKWWVPLQGQAIHGRRFLTGYCRIFTPSQESKGIQ